MGHQCRGRGKGQGDVCECIPWLTMFGVAGGGCVRMHCIVLASSVWDEGGGWCLNTSHSLILIGRIGIKCV